MSRKDADRSPNLGIAIPFPPWRHKGFECSEVRYDLNAGIGFGKINKMKDVTYGMVFALARSTQNNDPTGGSGTHNVPERLA
jgi:hypothetical protein